ncbi:histidine kinase dimerization/phosphoacceptor domain -containing protein [Hansschlegelia sp.]|uniref:histidine kinase dimerization/phosphoacceptor domain -containing protein n=1 Tax=Hansschlegelia sp. TaxID=2041892 RepID=UPI002C251926|nr:histidine kinase dimerization/phosphoacceptor domain -containing protein [Hansschlegelia sp.]HVI27731.1 histidine kinase dimerization/phosphoacceptor domain -containing protein [Hansschlegelia sp.]
MDSMKPPVSVIDVAQRRPDVSTLIHYFRNQLQTMTSLVSLAAQRAPGEESRAALEDLRARVEALTIIPPEEAAPGGTVAADRLLTLLAHRICQLYDPDRHRRVDIRICPLQLAPRETGTLAQILAELLVRIFRSELVNAEIILAEHDGALKLRALTKGNPLAAAEPASGALGELLLEGLARSLGGAVRRSDGDGLMWETSIPGQAIGVDFNR